MSRLVTSLQEFKDVVLPKPRAMVLFYASWCPFSRAFLPHFEGAAETRELDLVCFQVDDAEEDIDAFQVDIYPTVLFFEHGSLVKRLDGRAGAGLSETQLRDFLTACKGA